LLGKGGGKFKPPVAYAAGAVPNSVAVGDFNNDGKLDLAVSDGGASPAISILLGNGNGTFQPLIGTAVASSPYFLAAGDFNGDGKLDLAVVLPSNGAVLILLGNGDGTFRTGQMYAVGDSPIFVAVGDLNGDKKLDLVVSNYGYGADGFISILLGNGDGTFGPSTQYAMGSYPLGVTIADLNGDGKPDLAVANNSLSILLGNGDGTFQPPVNYAVRAPYMAVAADFNLDGKPDLAVSTSDGQGTVTMLLGNGDGTFAFPPTSVYSVSGAYSSFLATADFSGDGKPDLAVSSSKVAVLTNTTAKATGVN
jgi:hypothetical protein